jgi:hypothetical protein
MALVHKLIVFGKLKNIFGKKNNEQFLYVLHAMQLFFNNGAFKCHKVFGSLY